MGFVKGSIKAPSKETDPEGYATWSRCNDRVHSRIVNTLNPEIADSLIYYSTAHEVWKDLRERFSQSNAPCIFEIQQDIAYLRQEQLFVSAYYTKLKGLWDELASYKHGPQHDQQKLMQFLMGLNESYSAIRGQILLMNPLPSVRQAYSCLSRRKTTPHFHERISRICSKCCYGCAQKRQVSGGLEDGIDRSNTGRMEPTNRSSGSQNFWANRSSQGQDGGHFFD